MARGSHHWRNTLCVLYPKGHEFWGLSRLTGGNRHSCLVLCGHWYCSLILYSGSSPGRVVFSRAHTDQTPAAHLGWAPRHILSSQYTSSSPRPCESAIFCLVSLSLNWETHWLQRAKREIDNKPIHLLGRRKKKKK